MGQINCLDILLHRFVAFFEGLSVLLLIVENQDVCLESSQLRMHATVRLSTDLSDLFNGSHLRNDFA